MIHYAWYTHQFIYKGSTKENPYPCCLKPLLFQLGFHRVVQARSPCDCFEFGVSAWRSKGRNTVMNQSWRWAQLWEETQWWDKAEDECQGNKNCICVKLYCAFGWKLSPFSAEGGLEIIANISTSCTAFSLLLVPLIKSSQKIQQRRTQWFQTCPVFANVLREVIWVCRRAQLWFAKESP